jgi:two-component system, chemotaxis family, chemotaxis protein CheY
MTMNSKSNIPTLAARLARVHVLVVDDDIEILQLIRSLLSQLGFVHISTATDGAEAINMLKDRKATRLREIDMVITDWNMEPVTGLELVRFIRTSPDCPNPYMPIIMLSGRGEWSDVEKARDAGFSEYVIKPFTAKALCDRIMLCAENPRVFVSSASYKGPSRRRRGGELPPGVTSDRRQRKVENNMAGKAFKGKIGFDINVRQIFTPENVEGAQQVIEDTTSRFHEWVMRDISALNHTLRNAQQNNDPARYLGAFQRRAFSIKSRAGIFGYDLATQVAKSLFAICDKPLGDADNQLRIIEKHIATLHHIFQNDVKGMGGEVGIELIAGLNDLIRKYKQKPNG